MEISFFKAITVFPSIKSCVVLISDLRLSSTPSPTSRCRPAAACPHWLGRRTCGPIRNQSLFSSIETVDFFGTGKTAVLQPLREESWVIPSSQIIPSGNVAIFAMGWNRSFELKIAPKVFSPNPSILAINTLELKDEIWVIPAIYTVKIRSRLGFPLYLFY